jgi:arabinogalactan oligomer / maltooligosaccharide transport system substrate-binding protein
VASAGGSSALTESATPPVSPTPVRRGPQRRRSFFHGPALAILIVVIVVVAGASTYYFVYYAKKAGIGGCSKSTSISVWQDFSPTEFPAFSTAVKEYELDNPGQTVSWVNETTPSPSNYVAAAAACQAPDILIGTSDFAGGLYFDGYLANLSLSLPSSAFAPFLPTAIGDVTQGGAIYGFPLNVNGVAMIYNKELIHTLPANTNQMVAEAENATVTSGGKITTAGMIYGLEADGGYRLPAWQSGYGGQMFLPNGLPDLNTTATVQALEFLNNFTTTYKVEPKGVTAESTYEDQFETGKAGIIFDGPWDIQMYINALGASNVGVAPIPIVSQTGLAPKPFWGSIGAFVSNRNVSGANPTLFNESIKFAQFLASPAVEMELFNSSGDIPSLNSTFQAVKALNIPFVNGFLNQFFNASQPFPNTPQMSYYWDPYATEISDYVAGTITAQAAVAAIQSSILSQMTQNHIPPE